MNRELKATGQRVILPVEISANFSFGGEKIIIGRHWQAVTIGSLDDSVKFGVYLEKECSGPLELSFVKSQNYGYHLEVICPECGLCFSARNSTFYWKDKSKVQLSLLRLIFPEKNGLNSRENHSPIVHVVKGDAIFPYPCFNTQIMDVDKNQLHLLLIIQEKTKKKIEKTIFSADLI